MNALRHPCYKTLHGTPLMGTKTELNVDIRTVQRIGTTDLSMYVPAHCDGRLHRLDIGLLQEELTHHVTQFLAAEIKQKYTVSIDGAIFF